MWEGKGGGSLIDSIRAANTFYKLVTLNVFLFSSDYRQCAGKLLFTAQCNALPHLNTNLRKL